MRISRTMFIFLLDPSSIIVYPCHILSHCFVDLIDVTLAGEDASSKLVVNFADADIEGNVDSR